MSNMAVFTGMARALIVKDGKILLAKEKDEDVWETPGGTIDAIDDTPQDACKREVLEELGYECEVGPVVDLEFIEYKGKKGFWILYLCKLGKKVKEPDEDIKEIKWFTKEEVKELLEKKETDDHDIKAFELFVNSKLPK